MVSFFNIIEPTDGFSPFFCIWQVVELISSAIGDLVQGIYYENSSSPEVNRLLWISNVTCQIIWFLTKYLSLYTMNVYKTRLVLPLTLNSLKPATT